MVKPREIIEFGCGRRPFGLIKKAGRAERIGKIRKFVGVDIAKVRAEHTAKRLGLKKIPKNVSFINGDAVAEAEKLLPQSKDIIFASNLFTRSYADYMISQGMTWMIEKRALQFLIASKKALKPKGRIILIHGKKDAPIFMSLAKEAGLKSSMVELNDLQSQKSLAPFIRKVSSPEKRIKRGDYIYGVDSDISYEDLRPVAVIYRK
ncbi:MAG: class I SAM-dependent methyltransferase [archaeon]